MYAFLIDVVDLLRYGHVHFFLIFFAYVWLRWLVVQGIALAYKPFTTPHKASASIIIPVVDEPLDLFRDVLARIRKQNPLQTIVVINGPRNTELELICRRFKHVTCVWTPQAGKRNAVRKGLALARGDVVALVDSDTLWEKDTLRELLKPFADPKIGGVTTLQKILQPQRSLLTRFCDWLEDVRAHGSMKAMSVTGKVGCLPGRTIAFRRSILNKIIKQFMNERFMDLHKEVSDDRSLTNLCLQAGYKTVMQSTSVVYTDAPTTWGKFIKQQLRWAEGSQYNNLRMTPWMLRHAPLMLFIYWTDMLTPFFLLGVYGTFIASLLLGWGSTVELLYVTSPFTLLGFTLFGSLISIALRQMTSLSVRPVNLLYLLPFVILLTFVMTPIRIIGLACAADDRGWGTRRSAYKTKAARKINWAWWGKPSNA